MTNLSSPPLLLAALVAATLSGLHVQNTHAAGASRTGYGYPVKPFDRQHPIRGGFGDPRTLFRAPPTRDGVLHGSGLFTFHDGVDISAPNGSAVYPVADGTVVRVDQTKAEEHVEVAGADRRSFEYWHIASSVHVGQRVVTGKTVLGRIINPLLAGHLTPYRDTTRPDVARIELRTSDDAPALMPSFVRGSVNLVAEAYDSPAIPVPGQWNDMPITPARLTWRVETWNGRVAIPETTAWDTRTTIPSDSLFWQHYARGTYQNMSVFSPHYSWGQPGCFLFRLGTLDTKRLHDNVYRLVVTASDSRGNQSSSSLRFSVHNKAGWVGV